MFISVSVIYWATKSGDLLVPYYLLNNIILDLVKRASFTAFQTAIVEKSHEKSQFLVEAAIKVAGVHFCCYML